MAHKIVVLGDIDGEFRSVFAKLTNLHKKQGFAFAIFAGNFFKSDIDYNVVVNQETEDLIEGKIEVPLPVYFTLGHQFFPGSLTDRLDASKGELCPNVFAIGRKAIVKTSEGIRIVAISGRHQDISAARPSSWYAGGYNDKEAMGCLSYNKADILITSDWPTDITKGCHVPSAGPISKLESPTIANLTSGLKPKYHLSTSLAFYERAPFFHDTEQKPITRFLALAPFTNKLKEKWIYAFSLDPNAAPAVDLPHGTTGSPLVTSKKRKLESQQDAYDGYRFANGSIQHAKMIAKQHYSKRKKTGPIQPADCFFCLSNTSCEIHMVASIGDYAYLTVAKGPLPKGDTFPELGFPGHILIMPTFHTPVITAIPGEGEAQKTLFEMLQYRESLQAMVASKSKDEQGRSRLATVSWEISFSKGVHLHWQLVPVPVELATNGTIEAAFKTEAESLDYPAFMTEKDSTNSVKDGDHLSVQIWAEDYCKELAMPLDISFKFDMQFSRRVMAKLLGLAKRIDWKECAQNKAEEEADVSKFKELFEEFDFTLVEPETTSA